MIFFIHRLIENIFNLFILATKFTVVFFIALGIIFFILNSNNNLAKFIRSLLVIFKKIVLILYIIKTILLIASQVMKLNKASKKYNFFDILKEAKVSKNNICLYEKGILIIKMENRSLIKNIAKKLKKFLNINSLNSFLKEFNNI